MVANHIPADISEYIAAFRLRCRRFSSASGRRSAQQRQRPRRPSPTECQHSGSTASFCTSQPSRVTSVSTHPSLATRRSRGRYRRTRPKGQPQVPVRSPDPVPPDRAHRHSPGQAAGHEGLGKAREAGAYSSRKGPCLRSTQADHALTYPHGRKGLTPACSGLAPLRCARPDARR